MSIWETIASPIISIINKVVPDKAAAAAAVSQLNQLQVQGQLAEEMLQLQAITTAQTDINKVEAANPHIFVAGGRPAIIWICAAGLAMQLIIGPTFTWFTALLGHPTPFPVLDGQLLMTLTFSVLGLGAYRSYDKLKGTDTKSVSVKGN